LSATASLLGSVFLVFVVDPAIEVARPAVIDLSRLSRHDLVAAELTRRARAVRLVMNETEAQEVHAVTDRATG
jgi:hypothetical protein